MKEKALRRAKRAKTDDNEDGMQVTLKKDNDDFENDDSDDDENQTEENDD